MESQIGMNGESLKRKNAGKELDLRSPMIRKLELENQKFLEEKLGEKQIALSKWRVRLLEKFNWLNDEKDIEIEATYSRKYYRGEYK